MVVINIPKSAQDIPIDVWADFRIAEDAYNEDPTIEHLIEAVCAYFVDYDLSDMPVGTWAKKLDPEAPTFFSLYQYLNELIVRYEAQPLTVPFETIYNGEKFCLTAADTSLVLGLQPITVGESVTLLELSRKCGESFEDLYNLKIEFLAIMLRKEGEKLPFRSKDRERFINQRKAFWAKAPMSLAIDVQNYLDVLLVSILNLFPSGDAPQTKEGAAHWDKHGWNQIPANAPKAMNIPYAEVWDAPLEDAMFAINHGS